MKMLVDKCPAGMAIDMAVAKALGYECVCDEEPSDCPIHCNDPDVRFRYSTDIAAAWGLAKWFREKQPPVSIQLDGWGNYWTAWIDRYGISRWAQAETAPLAVCRAFLKANGVTEIES